MSLGMILAKARIGRKKSQESLALSLGVARKTIQNWENDISSPSIKQAIDYFKALGLSPLPALLEYLYPELKDQFQDKRKELQVLISDLPLETIDQLLNLFYGEHGSSPRAIMNLLSAHLETPMKDRVSNGSLIVKNYELAKKKHKTLERVKVDLELLHQALQEGEEAFVKGSEAYVLTKNTNDKEEK